MPERLYTEYPELYDAIQSDWNYDRDISFVIDTLAQHSESCDRVLEIGCGTGEHTRRFVSEGFDIVAIDRYAGMLDIAREKCDADFRQMSLPELTVDGTYELIVALRGVVNHLSPDELLLTLHTLKDRLADGGILVFDNSPLPPEGNYPALDVGSTEHGEYARIAQMRPTDDGLLSWDSVVFGPDGEFFTNSRKMTPFDDATITAVLSDLDFTVTTHDGFGPGDDRTVFVAVS